jgi:hypothetical protein
MPEGDAKEAAKGVIASKKAQAERSAQEAQLLF